MAFCGSVEWATQARSLTSDRAGLAGYQLGSNVQRIGTRKLAIWDDAATHRKSRRNIEIVRRRTGYVEQADSPNSRNHRKNITLLHGDWCWQGEVGN